MTQPYALLSRSRQLLIDVLLPAREDKLLNVMVLLKLGLVQRKVLLFINSINEGYRLRLFLEAFGIRSAVLNAELPLNSRHHILQASLRHTLHLYIHMMYVTCVIYTLPQTMSTWKSFEIANAATRQQSVSASVYVSFEATCSCLHDVLGAAFSACKWPTYFDTLARKCLSINAAAFCQCWVLAAAAAAILSLE